MNKKKFERYIRQTFSTGFWETIEVISDGEIVVNPEWREPQHDYPAEATVYQCCNPSICVEDYLEKQRRLQELSDMVSELKSDQKHLGNLIASVIPFDKPVLFRDTVVTVFGNKIEFQEVLKPEQIENPFTAPSDPAV